MSQNNLHSDKLCVVFMGTPDFALPSFHAVDASEEIIAVITQPDRPKGRRGVMTAPTIKIAAEERGLSVFQPERLRKADHLIETLRELAPDLIVVVAFGQILPENVLKIPKYGCINVHASLLPLYRGAGPIQWAIIRGETETGVTTMEMDAGMDTGAMLLKRTMRIGPDETAESLSPKLAEMGASLLLDTLADLKAGKLVPETQDDAQATLAPLLKKEAGLICWDESAKAIYNRWRGLKPWPGLTTFYKNERWKVTALKLEDEPRKSGHSGEILQLSETGFEVATGEGSILITGLKPEGKRNMTPLEYAAGHKIDIGTLLQSNRKL